jgi:hypothetical protein
MVQQLPGTRAKKNQGYHRGKEAMLTPPPPTHTYQGAT